jgi:hypothetical protein
MKNDYILYQKFTDIESAEEFATELKKNGIDYHLIDHNNDTNVKVQGYNTIDIAIGLNIMEQDFPKADFILEKYYDEQIVNIDKAYHLFEFTDHELKEIILNPFDWGRLDYQLAKHILRERGFEISETEVKEIKDKKITELSQKEKVSNFKIIIGYLLAFTIPIIPILIGLTIKYNRKILPTGEKFYIHSDKDRKHGHRIIFINLIYSCTLYVYKFFIKDFI